MSMLELCARIQETWVSRTISESTWGYPIVGALHVLAIALCSGAVLGPHIRVFGFAARAGRVADFADDFRWIRRAGLTLVVITGTLLFASAAVGSYKSASFRIKMVLLVLIVVNTISASRQRRSKLRSAISLALWAAVIFAARGIAFF
jgi:hypothetical protein